MNRLANVETIMARAGWLKRMMLRFRLPIQMRFKPSPHRIYSVGKGPGRTGGENGWYALTGRVVMRKAETDGDLQF